jgi:PEGA domain
MRFWVAIVVLFSVATAGAQSDDEVIRKAFDRGLALEESQDWGLALQQFRRAAALATGRRLAVVEFNIAVCERALGHFLMAREVFRSLLARVDQLEEPHRQNVTSYVKEMDGLIVRVPVHLAPASAALSVDGGPLLAASEQADLYLGGLSHDASAVVSIQREDFTLLLDRGAHVFRASRPGHKDAVVVRSFDESLATLLSLKLDELPATINVNSEPIGAVVKLNGREAGVTPLEVKRAAGRYQLEVERERYQSHREQLAVESGEHIDVTAPLALYRAPLTRKWWFWTAIASVAAVGAISTYFAVRPDPTVPPYDEGSAGWLARAP